MAQMMLRRSAKELGREWIICLFLRCSPLQLFPRICSIPAIISVPLTLSNCYTTHGAQFDFLSLQGPAVALETILPAPHLKRRRWADGLALKTHRPAWTLPCPSREAGERHLYVLAISSEWGGGREGWYWPCSVLQGEGRLWKAFDTSNTLSNYSYYYYCNKGHFNPFFWVPPFTEWLRFW